MKCNFLYVLLQFEHTKVCILHFSCNSACCKDDDDDQTAKEKKEQLERLQRLRSMRLHLVRVASTMSLDCYLPIKMQPLPIFYPIALQFAKNVLECHRANP